MKSIIHRLLRLFISGLSLVVSNAQAQTPEAPIIIDAHVHTSPQYYEPLLNLLASYGITRFVNLSGGHGDRLWKSIAQANIYRPRIAVCANLDWSSLGAPNFASDAVRMLEKASRQGAKCLKISKALGLYVTETNADGRVSLVPVDTPRLDPIWTAAGKLSLPVYIHTGDPKAFFEPLTPENERYDELSIHPDWSFYGPDYPSRKALLDARNRVFEKHPNTQFIAVHFANNPEDIDDVARVLDRFPNVHVDIAARVPELGRHKPAKVRRMFTKYRKRILMGSDLGFSARQIMLGSVGREQPQLFDIFEFYAVHEKWLTTDAKQMKHPTPIQGRWRIDAIALTDDVINDIYWRNALKLLWQTTPNAFDERLFLNGAPDMSSYLP